MMKPKTAHSSKDGRKATPKPSKRQQKQQEPRKSPEEVGNHKYGVVVMVGCTVVGVYAIIVLAFCCSWILDGSTWVRFWQQAALANPISKGGIGIHEGVGGISHAMPPGGQGSTPLVPEYLHEPSRVKRTVSFQMGRVEGVTYYHCSFEHGPPTPEYGMPLVNIVVPPAKISRDMVLLNGQRFLGKEIRDNELGGNLKLTDEQIGEHAWAQYCQSLSDPATTDHPRTIDNLVALEMEYTASPATVRSVLRALRQDYRLAALPVAALVTPEASAKTVVDWIVYGDGTAASLRRIARHWIPVSAGTFLLQAMNDDEEDEDAVLDLDALDDSSLSPEPQTPAVPRLASRSVFSKLDGWPVCSVYGHGDDVGAEAAHRLRKELPASAVKLKGGGMLGYLYYPDDFMAEVQRYMALDAASPGTTMDTTR